MKIVIATPLYPPDVGGPAYYAEALATALEKAGQRILVVPFSWCAMFPTGIRHALYFFRLLPQVFTADVIIALDMFSVGFPAAIAGLLARIPLVIRTGGDFLWEMYIERTKEKIPFSQFYEKSRRYTLKERIIFSLTRWTLHRAARVVFSTEYQRDIFVRAYGIPDQETALIENQYLPMHVGKKPKEKNYACYVRDIHWKNLDILKRAFNLAREKRSDIVLDLAVEIPRRDVLRRLEECYAVILVSLGDISPNFILEALSFGKPIILTHETGLKERLKDVALFVDPLNPDDIAEKILWLADDENYQRQCEIVNRFTFTRSYADIAHEFVNVTQELQV